jgi:hypothetical protein
LNNLYLTILIFHDFSLILLAIETLIILWQGDSTSGYFIFYLISLMIMFATVTNVSYTANKFVSSNFDSFVLSAFEESIDFQSHPAYRAINEAKYRDSTATDSSIVNRLSNRDRVLRDLTHFHSYIKNRTFAYTFPYEANVQISTLFTVISLGGVSYGFLKYLSASIPSEFIYRQY